MKSKALVAVAVASAFWSVGAIANPFQHYSPPSGPSAANETMPSITTVLSPDNFNGGYKGWGPMANPQSPSSVDESYSLASVEQERHHKQQLAEVRALRDEVWVANAPLRAEYENIGATRSEGRGFGRFFGR